jgi:ABC-type sugar transport system substrate-binding protein
MKKILSILLSALVISMAFTLSTACSSNNKTVKIGVIMYSWTDEQGNSIREFCDYLSGQFDVEFVYESTFYNDDAHINCVENLISAGAKAIISGYDTSLEASIQTCEDAGVYYVLALASAGPANAGNVTSKFFLGGTTQFGGDLAAFGKTYADAFIASGLKNVSGVSFPPFAFTEAPIIYASFKRAIEAAGDFTVDDLSFSGGFTPEAVQTATSNAIGPNTEAIFGMASGLDFVYPALVNNHPNVKLLALGYNGSVRSLFETGALIAAGNNSHPQSIVSCFVRVMNALEGKQYSDAASGEYNRIDGSANIVNGVAGYPVFTGVDSLGDYEVYGLGKGGGGMEDGPVTAAEIKRVLLSENPNATLAALNGLTSRTIADIKRARR